MKTANSRRSRTPTKKDEFSMPTIQICNNTPSPTQTNETYTTDLISPISPISSLENERPKILRFRCDDRVYEKWDIYDSTSLKKMDKSAYSIDPIEAKLFNQDSFEYDDETGKITLIHSTVREMPVMAGVIVMDKQYGMYKSKYLYRFVPDDMRLPVFLVPYKVKKVGFQKDQKNIYSIVKFHSWEDREKHPRCEIVQNIGNVDSLEAFYEYQLYCKSLNASIQHFTKEALKSLQTTTEEQYIERIMNIYTIEDRRHKKVICIDPKGSRDFDDGFGFETLDDGKQVLSIYIANVPLWLEILQLWSSFSQRISTIYLPDRKRPMMPSLLSDGVCSLIENTTRFAFTLDILIENESIVETRFCNSAIRVTKNYIYEQKELERDGMYKKALHSVSKLSRKFRYIDVVRDSHDFIMYIMILMNYICAKEFQKYEGGIFRSVKLSGNNNIPSELPSSMKTFLTSWTSTGGMYISYKDILEEEDDIETLSYASLLSSEEEDEVEKTQDMKTKHTLRETLTKGFQHDILKLDAYVHVTSPIRRLVDLLNSMELQQHLGLMNMSNKAMEFYQHWSSRESIEYINTSMRAIRRLQSDCDLLAMCMKKKETLERTYKGYVFDRIKRKDNLYQYVVYLPDIHMVTRHTTRHYHENYSVNEYKLYVFKNENNFKQKILLGYSV